MIFQYLRLQITTNVLERYLILNCLKCSSLQTLAKLNQA
jgi:hypothetical protein